MKVGNLFRILSRNAFRIILKSKALIIQLIVLLLIASSVLVTIFLSTFLMVKSKNTIVESGNLADATITIPETVLKQDTSGDYLEKSQNGTTQADLNLQTYLRSINVNYSFTKNLSLTDATSGTNFILSVINQANLFNTEPDGTTNVVNELQISGGNAIPAAVYNNKTEKFSEAQVGYFAVLRRTTDYPLNTDISRYMAIFDYDEYMRNTPWELASLLLNSVWNLSEDKTRAILPILEKLATPPQSREDYMQNYCFFNDLNIHINNPSNRNTNSYFYKLGELMVVRSVFYNGSGYTFNCAQVIPLIGVGGEVPFSITSTDKSSFFSIISSNYISANKGSKAFLSERTIQDAMNLPLKQNLPLNSFETNFVYNQETGQNEQFSDFLEWFNQLDDKYKVSINSTSYVIVGQGDSPDLLYPVQTSNQLFIDSSKTGVAYVNDLGFRRAIEGTRYTPYIYYSITYPKNNLFWQNTQLLNSIKQWTEEQYNEVTAYSLFDSKQPNFIFYLRSNFLNNIQKIVVVIGLVVGGVVLVLALVFVSLLLRSIIKLNKSTFGIALANGVKKTKLAFSFFPFALIPSIVVGILAFFVSYALINPTLGVISNYWTLPMPGLQIYWWILPAIIFVLFVILYSIVIAIIFITLRQNTYDIINNTSVFKINFLVLATKKITSKFNPLWSFRTSFMMSNISRFLILSFIVICLISIASVSVSSVSIFSHSLENNTRNKKYTASYDLYSPTINSGYYSAIPYNELGVSMQGSYNNLDDTIPVSGVLGSATGNYHIPGQMTSNFYNTSAYAEALKYPYSDENNALYFTSLFLVNSMLSDEINFNAHFLNNRVFNRLFIDVSIDALGSLINPWEFAKQIIPESIQYMANVNNELLAETTYQFFYWLQEQNNADSLLVIPELDGTEYAEFNNMDIKYSTYLPGITNQPFTLDGSDITLDYDNAANQVQWIFNKQNNSLTGTKLWVLNEKYAIWPAPNYTFKEQTLKLFVLMSTNNKNPLFQMWYKYIYDANPNKGQPGQIMPDYNYKIASGIVPIEQDDETYTYINSDIVAKNDVSINAIESTIYGINPESQFVFLYDKNNYDLKQKLNEYIVSSTFNLSGSRIITYPLVINKVVAAKNHFNVGDILNINAFNTFDRFNLLNINPENANANVYNCNFEVVGITDTNYENQYYTLQKYANQILGYGDFENVDNVGWLSTVQPGKGYVPFNGFFTSDTTMRFVRNYAGVYSPSGLTTILGNLTSTDGTGNSTLGYLASWFENNCEEMDNLMNAKLIVNRDDNNEIQVVQLNETQTFSRAKSSTINPSIWTEQTMNRIINLFGGTSLINIQLVNTDIPPLVNQIGSLFDGTILQIDGVIAASIITTLIIIIAVIAIILVIESKRLIALLKVLGYNNFQTAFSLGFVYYAVLLLGTLLSIPITIAFIELIKLIAFNSFSIILNPVVHWWVFVVGFVGVGVIFGFALLYIYLQMRKLNPALEIAVRQ